MKVYYINLHMEIWGKSTPQTDLLNAISKPLELTGTLNS